MKAMTNHGKLTVIIGPSGAGKSTHVGRLITETGAELIRTKTTRPRRGPGDDDTHVFVSPEEFSELKDSGQFLGSGAVLGYEYGLPNLPETDTSKVILLRAPFVPTVWHHRPDARVIQLEAPVDILIERLKARGDIERADPKQLEFETLMGRKLTTYIVPTVVPFEQSYGHFLQIWRKIQAE